MSEQPLLTFEEAIHFLDTGEIEQATHDRLFDHFCALGEMPYGTMKARDGDPYIWILDRLEQEYPTA